MEIKFHLRFLYRNRYQVTAQYKDFSFASNLSCPARTFQQLLTRARANCSLQFSKARLSDRSDLPKNNVYIWDGDTSDLPPEMIKTIDAPKQTPVAESTGERNLEVKKVNGTWTIIKHTEKLLTWAEACELLKERI